MVWAESITIHEHDIRKILWINDYINVKVTTPMWPYLI